MIHGPRPGVIGGMTELTKLPAGPDHSVAVVPGAPHAYRREPCSGCPWRVDQTGVFPPEAFEHSANTARPGSLHTFGCHESGIYKGATCAGFLLRGVTCNRAAETLAAEGHIDPAQVHDGAHALHASYRDMAIANGVPASHPVLTPLESAAPDRPNGAAV